MLGDKSGWFRHCFTCAWFSTYLYKHHGKHYYSFGSKFCGTCWSAGRRMNYSINAQVFCVCFSYIHHQNVPVPSTLFGRKKNPAKIWSWRKLLVSQYRLLHYRKQLPDKHCSTSSFGTVMYLKHSTFIRNTGTWWMP